VRSCLQKGIAPTGPFANAVPWKNRTQRAWVAVTGLVGGRKDGCIHRNVSPRVPLSTCTPRSDFLQIGRTPTSKHRVRHVPTQKGTGLAENSILLRAIRDGASGGRGERRKGSPSASPSRRVYRAVAKLLPLAGAGYFGRAKCTTKAYAAGHLSVARRTGFKLVSRNSPSLRYRSPRPVRRPRPRRRVPKAAARLRRDQTHLHCRHPCPP
jgi:hypothetical protein